MRHNINSNIQQRQILSMMGIDYWVRNTTPVVDFDVAKALLINQQNNQQADSLEIDNVEHFQSAHDDEYPQLNDKIDEQINDGIHHPIQNIAEHPINNIETADEQEQRDTSLSLNNPSLENTLDIDAISNTEINEPSTDGTVGINIDIDVVPAFSIQAICVEKYVLIVNDAILDNQDKKQSQLWQNICATLNQTPQNLTFPICENMQSIEIANACIAGFVFRVAQKIDDVELIYLTEAPSGLISNSLVFDSSVPNNLIINNLVSDDLAFNTDTAVPTLADMLSEPILKAQLWQKITRVCPHSENGDKNEINCS